jgi:hypothetical protein
LWDGSVPSFGNSLNFKALAKKICNFLHEAMGHRFPSLRLPRLPANRQHIPNVHAMLNRDQILSLWEKIQLRTRGGMEGHLSLFNTLKLSSILAAGSQRIYAFPFKKQRFYKRYVQYVQYV